MTLVEVIVTMAILSILVSFILVAINKVRENALLTQNKNNTRQIILGIHQISSMNDGKINDLARASMKGIVYARSDMSLFQRLIPYVHGSTGTYSPDMTVEQMNDWAFPKVAVYRDPADATWDLYPVLTNRCGKCSYAFNMVALDGSINLISSLPDGSSQTIALGDKYYASAPISSLGMGQSLNDYSHLFDPINGEYYGVRRATFADSGWHDVVPVTDLATSTTGPSIPDKTFQVRPQQVDIDARVLQSPFSAGLTVGLFDGSVKTLPQRMTGAVFWALVTPNGRETVSLE